MVLSAQECSLSRDKNAIYVARKRSQNESNAVRSLVFVTETLNVYLLCMRIGTINISSQVGVPALNLFTRITREAFDFLYYIVPATLSSESRHTA